MRQNLEVVEREPTCIRSFIRSSGAVTDFAAAPANAPAKNRAASFGTNDRSATGFFNSWAEVGANTSSSSLVGITTETDAKAPPDSLRSLLIATDKEAKLLRTPPLLVFPLDGSLHEGSVVRAKSEVLREGMLRNWSRDFSSPMASGLANVWFFFFFFFFKFTPEIFNCTNRSPMYKLSSVMAFL